MDSIARYLLLAGAGIVLTAGVVVLPGVSAPILIGCAFAASVFCTAFLFLALLFLLVFGAFLFLDAWDIFRAPVFLGKRTEAVFALSAGLVCLLAAGALAFGAITILRELL